MVAMAGAAGVPILVAQMVTLETVSTVARLQVIILVVEESQETQMRALGGHQAIPILVVGVVVVQAYLMPEIQAVPLPQEVAAHREVGPVERGEAKTPRLPGFPVQ